MNSQKKKDTGDAIVRKPLAIVEVQEVLHQWYDLQYNEVKHVVEGRKKGEGCFNEMKDNNLLIQLLSNGYRISQSTLKALLNSDFVPSFNPILKYFESLPPWDEGNRDYITELANHVKAIDQQQFNHHFKKMMVRTVACAVDDHLYNKHAFILVGSAQHTGKSTFCRFLCPNALANYRVDTIPQDKDGMISLSENMFINLDELSSMNKFELNHLKSLFSIDSVRVRHPYGSRMQTDPRRASFIGSTNEQSFLTDTTGSVRWLCFEIDSIEFNYESIGIDNVWSQAYALYKSGFRFQLTADELKENESRNEQYQAVTMEYEYVQQYFTPSNVMESNTFMTTTEIRDHIIKQSERRADLKSLDKLGKALAKLGFERVPKRIGESKEPVRGYYVNLILQEN